MSDQLITQTKLPLTIKIQTINPTAVHLTKKYQKRKLLSKCITAQKQQTTFTKLKAESGGDLNKEAG